MEGTSRTLPYTIRFVGLLGSHSLGKNQKFMATAVDLGRELIRRRISLAYGGGNVGLQGAVDSTVFTNGGLVRGFIPGYIATQRVYGPTYGVEHTVSSNYYKYFEMNHAVKAFIILPGGVDTMEGLFTLISWASEGLHNRPIGLLNIDGYFNNLIKFLDDAVRQNFMSLSQRKLFISSFFVGELLDKLEFAKAFPGPGKANLIHDPSSIYYLHPSKGPGNSLTKYVLRSDNYDVWEKVVLHALAGHGKAKFLTAAGVPKPTDEAELGAWESNHSIICSWLCNSVDESIQRSVINHTIAFDLWNDLKKRYGGSNGPRMYQLKCELHNLCQKDQSVVAYYNQFITLWNQLYGCEDPTGGCMCPAAVICHARVEREKTMDFLLGLDDEQYGHARSQILGTEPIPDLDQAFYLVTQEERHRTIIRSRDDRTDDVAFAVWRSPSNLSCSHCGRTNHTIDTCFELIGFPEHYGRGGGRSGMQRGRGGRTSGGRGYPSSGRDGSRGPARPGSTSYSRLDGSVSHGSNPTAVPLLSQLESTSSSSHMSPPSTADFPILPNSDPAQLPSSQPSASQPAASPGASQPGSGDQQPAVPVPSTEAARAAPTATAPHLRQSSRVRQPPQHLSDYVCHTALASSPVLFPPVASSVSVAGASRGVRRKFHRFSTGIIVSLRSKPVDISSD
ncbi:unnamed protein product [Cuscuta campestris]|uniref:cytokinin riboside 5'-monophosphate phosphoribohydrolase n=1 Tax=Cuscuta campestris TaxID=132261 RepID=A0A484KIB8_9ASTE|nr:unnamed protein product [Cuscuta campestris]